MKLVSGTSLMNSKIGLKLQSIPLAAVLLLIVACGGGSSEGDRNRGPLVSFDIPETITEGAQVTFAVTATDSDGYVDEYNWTQIDGPEIQFTNGSASITFTVPEVSEDTDIGFLVRVVDNIGAVTSVQFYSTIQDLPSKLTQLNLLSSAEEGLSLKFAQVSEPIDMSGDRWMIVVNKSNASLQLGDYILLSSGLDSVNFEVSENEFFELPEISLAPGQEILLKDSLSHLIWGELNLKDARPLVLGSNDNAKTAYWLKGDKIRLVNKSTQSVVDIVEIGENK